MDQHSSDHLPSNPFATRFVRPGEIDFLFSDEDSLPRVAQQLQQNHWRGQIIGPHGSGKSTLLASLLPVLPPEVHVRLHTLRDGQRRLAFDTSSAGEGCTVLLVIDGFEQLSRWQRWRIHRHCRRRNWGLLITAHADLGLPTLFTTQTSEALARQLAERRLGGELSAAALAEVQACYRLKSGNCREMLFDLYDRYEAQPWLFVPADTSKAEDPRISR